MMVLELWLVIGHTIRECIILCSKYINLWVGMDAIESTTNKRSILLPRMV